MTGIIAADYWIIRRRKWVIPDIYKQDGIYWYSFGVNWRAYVAFIMSFVFDLREFARSVSIKAMPLTRYYQLGLLLRLITLRLHRDGLGCTTCPTLSIWP
jgi:NCS1 family nucleobase:cation symporter-1